MAPLSSDQLAGYLLEEVVAWILQASGYKLLTMGSQDKFELVDRSNGLRVRGRGAEHQVDALGEFSYVPPFSLPLRMFVEAKCNKTRRIGLAEVRNAYGVIHDVNQNWTTSAQQFSKRRQRYHYLYSLFSTSGFTEDAQDYAQAHQLVLIDLSDPAYHQLGNRLRRSSQRMVKANRSDPFPTSPVRSMLRQLLRTAPPGSPPVTEGAVQPSTDLGEAIIELHSFITNTWRSKFLLGFPALPVILAVLVRDVDRTIAALSRNPVQRVSLRYEGLTETETASRWTASPVDARDRLDLGFTLPRQIGNSLLEHLDQYGSRPGTIGDDHLTNMSIIYSSGDNLRIFKLIYDVSEWGRDGGRG